MPSSSNSVACAWPRALSACSGVTTASGGTSPIWRVSGNKYRLCSFFAGTELVVVWIGELLAVELVAMHLSPGLHHLVQPKGQTLGEHILLVGELPSKLQTSATEALQHALDVTFGVRVKGLR